MLQGRYNLFRSVCLIIPKHGSPPCNPLTGKVSDASVEKRSVLDLLSASSPDMDFENGSICETKKILRHVEHDSQKVRQFKDFLNLVLQRREYLPTVSKLYTYILPGMILDVLTLPRIPLRISCSIRRLLITVRINSLKTPLLQHVGVVLPQKGSPQRSSVEAGVRKPSHIRSV